MRRRIYLFLLILFLGIKVDLFAQCGDVFFTNTHQGLTATYTPNIPANCIPISFNWDFGDGTSDTSQLPIHTYNTAGNYNVCLNLSMYDSNMVATNCTFCDTVMVGQNLCDSVRFAHAKYHDNTLIFYPWVPSGINNPTYNWTFGNYIGSIAENPHIIFPNGGMYNVCLTVSGFDNQQQPITCTYCDSTFVPYICDSLSFYTLSNGLLTFFAPSYGVTGFPMPHWTRSSNGFECGDGGIAYPNYGKEHYGPAFYTYNQPGTYTVHMYYSDLLNNDGIFCEKLDTITVDNNNFVNFCDSVDYTYNVEYSFTHVYFTLKVPQSYDVLDHYWVYGNDTIKTIENPYLPQIHFDQEGAYNVCMTAYGLETQQNKPFICTKCKDVYVFPSNNEICTKVSITNTTDGLTANFTSSIPWNLQNPTYLWDLGDGTTSTQANPSHTYSQNGTYSITLTVNGYGGGQLPITCTKYNYVFIDNTNQLLCDSVDFTTTTEELTANFTSHLPAGITSPTYSWNFGNGTTSTQENPSCLYNYPGTYNVCMTVSGTNYKQQPITCTYCKDIIAETTPSVPSDENSRLKVYPNPTRGDVKIELPGKEMFELKLYDVTGKLILSHDIDTNSKIYNFKIDRLSKGSYYIVVESSEGRKYHATLIKQ